MHVYTRTNMHMYTHTHTHTHAHTHTHTHTLTHTHTYTHTHTNTRSHTRMHKCAHTHTDTHAGGEECPVAVLLWWAIMSREYRKGYTLLDELDDQATASLVGCISQDKTLSAT